MVLVENIKHWLHHRRPLNCQCLTGGGGPGPCGGFRAALRMDIPLADGAGEGVAQNGGFSWFSSGSDARSRRPMSLLPELGPLPGTSAHCPQDHSPLGLRWTPFLSTGTAAPGGWASGISGQGPPAAPEQRPLATQRKEVLMEHILEACRLSSEGGPACPVQSGTQSPDPAPLLPPTSPGRAHCLERACQMTACGLGGPGAITAACPVGPGLPAGSTGFSTAEA